MSPSYTGVAVVIPALNEEASLPGLLAAIPAVGQVLVVDNGSTDDTAAVAAAAGATVLSQPARGYGQACQVGIAHAAAHGAEVLVILDADHADEPGRLGQLVDPILAGHADMVLSDRTEHAEPGALMPQQRLGNALATWLILLVTGHRYQDMGPFRAIRMGPLLAMAMEDPTWGWNVEMQIKAIHHGLRVQEVPLPYRNRAAGESKISGSLVGTLRAGMRMLWAAWRYAR
jgi:glycosyltransferase involved in cell wall biosynthesis